MRKRTLYECSNARVRGERIYCGKEVQLSSASNDGSLDIKRLARGEPLAIGICQGCLYFDSMGPPVPKDERGWLNGTGAHIK